MSAVLVHDCGNPLATTERFRVSMAQTLEDVIQCQRLRYLVFNCELGEGLDSSANTGLDRDRYDFICDHLMVQERRRCQSSGAPVAPPQPPRLFRAYLDISACICGPPAIDREFKTIDFLTLVDLRRLPDRVRTRFF